ncbi:class E sortase [Streptomyces sp. G-G2]|uniref:class E sortase n=1 Tax=Streptomyces sp. G-G2 TaxID=3046201 RepID=UPI0024BB98FB|nr:class E sortase [Streptomyces sp. G-G2]MDJ0379647.1 class E sortase [Streptomyces sp. G-G2]
MRDHIPVVVQGSGRRARRVGIARVLWGCAELTVTLGVVVLLLVVHQMWWTNRQAVAGAREQVRALERAWDREAPASGAGAGPESESDPQAVADPVPEAEPEPEPEPEATPTRAPVAGAGSAGRGVAAPGASKAYAVLRIPRLGLVVPVAQGVDKAAVLDKGYAGHYPGTAQPGAQGNFALAGHRNTHGEPFRYINRLRAGDEIQVEARGRTYTYVVGQVLPETTARDTGVIAPVPRSVVRPGSGYDQPGAYITLTTCTPEYTSTYRLVVWGTLKG